MRGRPGRGILSAALACGLLVSGCTDEPVPLPPESTTAVPTTTATTPPDVVTPAPPAVPTPTVASPTETASTPAFQELRATLELFSREKLQEGASAILIKAKVGSQEWTHAAGVRSRDGRVAAQPGDRFQVGGQVRTMIAVSVMKLVDEGRLRLDDAITTLLPTAIVPATNPVTIRQLLGNRVDLPGAQADALLAQVVEQLRGAPLDAVLRTDILAPLNLGSTGLLGANTGVPDDLVHGYVRIGSDTVDVTSPGTPGSAASAGLMSSVEDITRFQAALLNGQLMSPQSLIDMKGTVFADYGLGLDHWHDRCTNGTYFGHAGDVPGYGSIAISSADGNRQLAIFMAYPPLPAAQQPSALALEMTGVAQVALNTVCRFQFR